MSGFARYPSLDGRVAFVSGGSSGLGAEFVRHLAAQGSRVAFVDVDHERGAALQRELGDDALFLSCDVRDVPALRDAIARTADRFGPVRILVNNAADDRRHRVEEFDVALWDDRMAVNLRHHFFAAQAVAPHIDLVDLPAHITAKAGIEGLTRTLARELGPSRMVLWLAADDSRACTAQRGIVDGGWM
jgi:NAD(P)-dependent dehydrogenase (short-subunit alcohol dehydrogenase family)